MKAVEVNHLYKSYADVTAVHDLTFCVDPGEILGLIGPNGAGKSSTIKIILDFMKPDSGEVKLFGCFDYYSHYCFSNCVFLFLFFFSAGF